MASAIDTTTLDAARAGSLYNEDLAPVTWDHRKWGLGSFAALWISMSACIPTYMLASSLIGGGMNWWEAILTVFLGNLIVLIPMVLNAHAGTKYGIPFPILCRASFGTRGANLPALLRALVACGWFGIQTWIGGSAIYKILAIFFPGLAAPGVPLEYQSSFINRTWATPTFLGVSSCRWVWTDSFATFRVRSRTAQSRPILFLFLSCLDRNDRFLGNAIVEHS